MLFLLPAVLAATAWVAQGDYTPEALADEVTNLPGAENLNINFRQFSGYLDITTTKHMHYWFTESSRSPSTDPLVFWTNGGPGCSGLLGFLGEMGPFRPAKDLTLAYNNYSWNTIANMVFIESPCGVGFSYSSDGTGDDYHTDDAQTAKDNYALIQSFLTRFPQYKTNNLYLTSESYGGHYLPTLSKEIVDRNSAGQDPILNFKGFMVGNPATTFYSMIPAGLDTYWGHQLVSQPLYDAFVKECKGPGFHNITLCETYFLAMYKEVGNLNPYALDYPVCLEDSPRKYGRMQRTWLINNAVESMFEVAHQQKNMRAAIGLEPVAGYEPCEEDYMTAYLNQASVKTALHVKSDVEWKMCSYTLRYKQTDGKNDMTTYYKYLIDGGYGLNILVYSGDDDDVCATIGSQSWVWGLGYDTAQRWKSYTVDGQVGGYLTKFKNTKFSFATVHGAGHEVPTYKPNVALYLFDSYLKGELTNA